MILSELKGAARVWHEVMLDMRVEFDVTDQHVRVEFDGTDHTVGCHASIGRKLTFLFSFLIDLSFKMKRILM